MGININTKELIEILNSTPAEQNIMLVGRHGIGKSEILTNYYQKKGFQVIALFLGQMSDPGDLIGLPFKDHISEDRYRTSFMPPYWFPLDDKPIVLFLDELNRARPEILQTIMDLALNRKLAGRKLPDGSRIISAVNEGEEYQLTDLDPALVSRFNIYNFRPTVQEWLIWADKNKLDTRVTEFIQSNSEWLDGNPGQKAGTDTGMEKSPDRRAWKKVSDVLVNIGDPEEVHSKMIAGIVGASASAKFFGSISGRKVLSGVEVLSDFGKHKIALSRYKLHQLSMVNDSIFRHLEVGEILPEQIAPFSKNLAKYYEMLETSESNEAIAHFASCFEKGNYQKAILFILDHSPKIYDKLMRFISHL